MPVTICTQVQTRNLTID